MLTTFNKAWIFTLSMAPRQRFAMLSSLHYAMLSPCRHFLPPRRRHAAFADFFFFEPLIASMRCYARCLLSHFSLSLFIRHCRHFFIDICHCRFRLSLFRHYHFHAFFLDACFRCFADWLRHFCCFFSPFLSTVAAIFTVYWFCRRRFCFFLQPCRWLWWRCHWIDFFASIFIWFHATILAFAFFSRFIFLTLFFDYYCISLISLSISACSSAFCFFTFHFSSFRLYCRHALLLFAGFAALFFRFSYVSFRHFIYASLIFAADCWFFSPPIHYGCFFRFHYAFSLFFADIFFITPLFHIFLILAFAFWYSLRR